MEKPNILLGRIDNRLVHGQVGVSWTNYLGANLIIVADDEVAQNEIQQVFIITKTPKEMRALIDNNVPIEQVNVGNMHFSEGKRQISQKVFVDDEDMENLHAMQEKGVRVYIQEIPGKLEEALK